MSKNLDKLISYREKYAKYLLNPEAKIHPETKQVEPHVFVIPFSKFKELELQEHFGPFLTIVQYNDFTDIETAALDPRFQKKAMSALIFGGSRMTPELERARDLFRQNQHSVVTNSHLYEEFDMNFPFGGVGSDSSISTLAQIEKTGVRVQNRNRPLLISKEVENVFHKKDSIQQVEPSLKEWKPLGKTQITEPITIKEIQKLARDQGLAMPVSYSYENSKERIEAQKLNGIKLIEPKDQKRDFPGVLLHTVDVKNILQKQNYLGKLNPLLSDVERHRQLLTKDKELSLVRSVDPSLMPNAKTLFESMERSPEFESQRQDILARLKSFSKRTSEEEFDKLERIVHIFIHRILEDVRRSHPRGAYIKNYGEFASGDVGNTITTFQSSAAQITKEFMLWVRQGFVKFPAKGYMDQAFQGFITGGNHANSTRFVNRFLIDPDNILVQDRLDTAQTDLGLPMEFRVDFIQGQAVLSRMRFGYEYYPREIKNSMEVLNAFMKKAPEEVRHLSGGADVALTRDGHWVIFEFNFGGASGTLSPEYYPFEANEIFSLLQDKKTWLLEFGDNLLRKSLAEQKAFIQTLKNAKPIWWRISVDDISQLEWARWLRDKKLENWAKSENKKEAASKLREELSALLLDLGSYGNLDFQRLYESADHYLFREGY